MGAPSGPWDKPAQVDGEVVHLTYLGSECRDDATVRVEEDSRQVILTVEETDHSRSCSDVGVVTSTRCSSTPRSGNATWSMEPARWTSWRDAARAVEAGAAGPHAYLKARQRAAV